MAPFQSISTKMKYSQNIPTPQKKEKEKNSFNFLHQKNTFFDKNSFLKKNPHV
jgi:hypothetical protein